MMIAVRMTDLWEGDQIVPYSFDFGKSLSSSGYLHLCLQLSTRFLKQEAPDRWQSGAK
jgi:hypothetical protein